MVIECGTVVLLVNYVVEDHFVDGCCNEDRQPWPNSVYMDQLCHHWSSMICPEVLIAFSEVRNVVVTEENKSTVIANYCTYRAVAKKATMDNEWLTSPTINLFALIHNLTCAANAEYRACHYQHIPV